MRKTVNKETIKYNRSVSVIIAIFILLPVSYLIYLNYQKRQNINNVSEKNNLNNNFQDSSLIKLQSAVDLAKSSPNEINYINLSLQYYRCRKYSECVEAAKKVLEYNINSYYAYNNLCSAYNQLGLWDDAIIAGQKALAVKPGDQLAQNNLKVSFDGKKSQEESVLKAEELVKKQPDENNYLNLGNVYYYAKKFELAIKCYEKVLTYNSRSAVAYNNICSSYNEMGNYEKAEKYCFEALKIDSTYSLAKGNLKLIEENKKKNIIK